MAIVFLSYRRNDSAQATGRIYDKLVSRFGAGSAFLDIDRIPPGVRFDEHLKTSLSQTRTVVVVIGTDWLSKKRKFPFGASRRLDDPNDFVRAEVVFALENDKPIIPVLVDGAQMPRREELPAEIEALVNWNAIEVRHTSFQADIEKLFQAIEQLSGLQPMKLNAETARDASPVVLVSCEAQDHKVDEGLQTKLKITLKNNGKKSYILRKGVFEIVGSATMRDCMNPRYSLIQSSWSYDVDLTGDGSFQGKHYLRPNEVEQFEVVVGRGRGGPELSVYKVNLELEFDEGLSSILIADLFISLMGPSKIAGMYISGVSPEQFCSCMAENLRDFDAIGYDLRSKLHPRTRQMMDDYSDGKSLDKYSRS